jgi:hypothetical protein
MGTKMKLLNLANFELPAVFAKLTLRGGQPPASASSETRHADDLVRHPSLQFCDPNALNFKRYMMPVVPGNANVTMGMGMVEYSGQPLWDRSAGFQAGPVKKFFQGILFDNRVKHL